MDIVVDMQMIPGRKSKGEFGLFQTSSLQFHLIQFVKRWRIFLELNSKRLSLSSGKEE